VSGYTARVVGRVLDRDQRLAYISGPEGEVRVRWRHRRVTGRSELGYVCDEHGHVGRYPQACPHALAMSVAVAAQRDAERAEGGTPGTSPEGGPHHRWEGVREVRRPINPNQDMSHASP
jgi:hypothetical protein